MSTPNERMSPDEQVYQSNKHEPEVREVYSNEPDESGPGDEAWEAVASQDEVSKESFPASDSPPNAAPAKPKESAEGSSR